MKLLGIVIKNYNNQFVEEVFNLSPEYIISFDFKSKELKIEPNPSYLRHVYGPEIYGITPVVGQNGCGKSTLLNLIGYNMQDKCNDNRLGFSEGTELTSEYFIVFEARNNNYYLECFNYRPENLKEVEDEESLESKIIGTDTKAYENPSGFCSVFISKNYEYRLLNGEKGIDYKSDEEIIYALSDPEVHEFEDQAFNYSDLENVFMRRTYISAANSLKGEYIAYDKLVSRGMLSSDLRLKFNLKQLIPADCFYCFSPNVHEPEMHGTLHGIHNWKENMNDFLGNTFVTFASRMLSIAGREEVARQIRKEDTYNNEFKEIMSHLAEAILPVDVIEQELFEKLDKQLNITNVCLGEYYRLNKRLIASLFMIRKDIKPGIGYFIIAVSAHSKVDKNIKEFLKRYDELALFYSHVFKNNNKVGDEPEYDEIMYDRMDYNSDAFYYDSKEAKETYRGQCKVEPIMSFDTELMSDGEKRLIRLVGTIFDKLVPTMFRSYRHARFTKVIPVIVDEIETNLHLEWSRNFISVFEGIIEEYLREITKETYKEFRREIIDNLKTQIQLIFTTHSPFMLSDIVQNNTIILSKKDDRFYQNELTRTFAANIQEIMASPMFVSECYGAHAIDVINAVIGDLNDDQNRKIKYFYNEEDELKIIENIGEPVLRNKLLEMYHWKYGIDERKMSHQEMNHSEIDDIMRDKELSDEEKAIRIKEYVNNINR